MYRNYHSLAQHIFTFIRSQSISRLSANLEYNSTPYGRGLLSYTKFQIVEIL